MARTRVVSRQVWRQVFAGRPSIRAGGLGWMRGGNDYAGCDGFGNGIWNFSGPGLHQCPHDIAATWEWHSPDYLDEIGIFSPNSATKFRTIKDGTSHTLLVGDVGRSTPTDVGYPENWSPSYWPCSFMHHDGWAFGGTSTLFSTNVAGGSADPAQLGGFNTGHLESAGSEHPGGANFCFADGVDEGIQLEFALEPGLTPLPNWEGSRSLRSGSEKRV